MKLILGLLLGVGVLWLIGLLGPVLRWAGRLAIAAAVTVVAVVLLPLDDGEGWAPWAVFVGTLLLLSTLLLSTRWRRRPRVVKEWAISDPVTRTWVEFPLGSAWPTLLRLADWRTRRRLDAAADRCSRYMAVADRHEDPSAQLPIKIRKHLPIMIADCLRHAEAAPPTERRALLAQALASLEAVAARADARRAELAHDAQGDLRARMEHLNRPDD